MRKMVMMIMALFMSIMASASTLDEIYTDINGTNINLASIDFNQDCIAGTKCSASVLFNEPLIGKTYTDYLTLDSKGNLTNKQDDLEKNNKFKKEEVDNIVTIRLIAVDPKSSKDMVSYWFSDYKKQTTWQKLSTDLKMSNEAGGITSAAVLMGNVSNAGFSNGASAGAGLIGVLLDDSSKSGNFLFFMKIQYKNGKSKSGFVLFRNTTIDSANFGLYMSIRKLKQ